MAVELLVVHLKIRHRATELTPPGIPTEDLLAQTFVRRRVQPQGSGFRANHLLGRFLTEIVEEDPLLFARQELVIA